MEVTVSEPCDVIRVGRPFKWDKFNKSQKAHLHTLRDACVQYEINPPMGFQDLLRKLNVARYRA